MIVASLLYPPLLPAAGEDVYVSRVILFYSYFLNTDKLTLLSSFRVRHNPPRLYFANEAVMLVNSIKRLFIVRVFRKNEHPCQDDHSHLIYHTSFTLLLKLPN